MSHVTQLRALLTGEGPTFSKTPPSPLNLKRGSTFPPKSSHPQEGGLKAWPAGPVLANKLSPLRGCS